MSEKHINKIDIVKGEYGLPGIITLDTNEDVTLGRASHNGIIMNDIPKYGMLGRGFISRNHAKFSVDKRGFCITDLASMYGTFVNGGRIIQTTHLRTGDVIGFVRLEGDPFPRERYRVVSAGRVSWDPSGDINVEEPLVLARISSENTAEHPVYDPNEPTLNLPEA